MNSTRCLFGSACLLLVLSASARAQDPSPDRDIVLLGPDESFGPRVSGLAGAGVALADDANAILTNPAGLVTVPRAIDAGLGVGHQWQGAERAGASSWLAPTFAGVAVHPAKTVAFGIGFWAVRRTTTPAAGSSSPSVTLVDKFPLGIATALGRYAAVGVTARFTQLRVGNRGVPTDQAPLGDDTSVTLRAGLLLLPSPQVRAGFTYQQAQRWHVDGGTGPGVGARMPEVFSLGIGWRADFANSTRLLVSSQADLLRDKLSSAPARTQDRAEWRLGAELSMPFQCYAGCGSMWQVRAGAHYQTPAPPGTDLGGGTLDRRSHLNWALGGSLALRAVSRGRLRLDVMGGRSAGRPVIQMGLAIRYSESFRSDLRYNRRPPQVPQPSEEGS